MPTKSDSPFIKSLKKRAKQKKKKDGLPSIKAALNALATEEGHRSWFALKRWAEGPSAEFLALPAAASRDEAISLDQSHTRPRALDLLSVGDPFSLGNTQVTIGLWKSMLYHVAARLLLEEALAGGEAPVAISWYEGDEVHRMAAPNTLASHLYAEAFGLPLQISEQVDADSAAMAQPALARTRIINVALHRNGPDLDTILQSLSPVRLPQRKEGEAKPLVVLIEPLEITSVFAKGSPKDLVIDDMSARVSAKISICAAIHDLATRGYRVVILQKLVKMTDSLLDEKYYFSMESGLKTQSSAAYKQTSCSFYMELKCLKNRGPQISGGGEVPISEPVALKDLPHLRVELPDTFLKAAQTRCKLQSLAAVVTGKAFELFWERVQGQEGGERAAEQIRRAAIMDKVTLEYCWKIYAEASIKKGENSDSTLASFDDIVDRLRHPTKYVPSWGLDGSP